MKFQKLFFGLPLFLALTLATSCKKDVADLPEDPATAENASPNPAGGGYKF